MHWTLQALILLCIVCLFGNAVRQRITGLVYLPGLLICGAWGLQQSYWLTTGGDNATIFALCDAAILAVLFRAVPSPREWLIIALFPVMWAAQIMASGALTWWINWAAVAAQMVLGLPWPSPQEIVHSVSHGAARRQAI